MINTPRNKMGEQPPKERINNFKEVTLGFDEKTAVEEAERCLQCKNAPCMKGCPVSIHIPDFIRHIKEGEFDKAVKVIKADNNLPAVCGRVCPQESQCERLCVRNTDKLGGAVAIGNLERFAGDCALSGAQEELPAAREKNGMKVAVIGSGPAGLACAADLALAGFSVTVFESFHKAGGVLVYGIPEFRLPKALVEAEVGNLARLGVEIKLNTVIGKTVMLCELEEEFDAVFIGTGAGLPMFLNIKGENLNGVYSANEYLTRINLMKAYDRDAVTPVQAGRHVAVIGAGNVAMDAARTALRLGAEEVTLIYRRSREEMPARAEEIHHAEEEGVIFNLLTNPVEILGENGRVKGIKCIKMELGAPDASGRRSPVPIEGSEYETECDQVIVAVGTSPNPLLKKSCEQLQTGKKGTIIINEETGETSIEGVYAGGDAVTGAATVIQAMGAGKLAAKSIIERLTK